MSTFEEILHEIKNGSGSLEVITIYGDVPKEGQFEELCRILPHVFTLKDLHIVQCELTDKHVLQFLGQLPHIKSLELLDFNDNKISDDYKSTIRSTVKALGRNIECFLIDEPIYEGLPSPAVSIERIVHINENKGRAQEEDAFLQAENVSTEEKLEEVPLERSPLIERRPAPAAFVDLGKTLRLKELVKSIVKTSFAQATATLSPEIQAKMREVISTKKQERLEKHLMLAIGENHVNWLMDEDQQAINQIQSTVTAFLEQKSETWLKIAIPVKRFFHVHQSTHNTEGFSKKSLKKDKVAPVFQPISEWLDVREHDKDVDLAIDALVSSKKPKKSEEEKPKEGEKSENKSLIKKLLFPRKASLVEKVLAEKVSEGTAKITINH